MLNLGTCTRYGTSALCSMCSEYAGGGEDSPYSEAITPYLRPLRIHTTCYMSQVSAVGSMTFLNSVMGGFGVAAGVVTVLAISNGLSTYIFDGQTITQKVDARLGGNGGAV